MWSVKIYMSGLELHYGRYVRSSPIGAKEAVAALFPGARELASYITMATGGMGLAPSW
jgi:hypothetical protein